MLENIAKPVSNPINQLFKDKKSNILSVYFTAGYPSLHDTIPTIQALEQAGADLVEIGIPFSDPIADGETIQQSSQQALKNGMNLTLLFQQLADIRKTVKIPLILMGYLNPIMQFGMQEFCQKCLETGINGLIIPDLPMYEYLNEYKQVFENYGLENIFLITPQTNEERIQHIDLHTKGFIYMVSSASVTGAKQGISDTQIAYFQRIANMKLKNPLLVGFGISDKQTFDIASKYASGAIIGSAFIKAVGSGETGNLDEKIKKFIASING